MKNLFMSAEHDQIDNVYEYLKKAGVKVSTDWYIGYKLVTVKDFQYYNALKLGSLYIMRNKLYDISWISPDNWKMNNMYDLALLSKQNISTQAFAFAVLGFDPRFGPSKSSNEIDDREFEN